MIKSGLMNRSGWIIIIVALWTAFGLRVWGLDFGLPYELHPDERQYVNVAIEWYRTGTLNVSFVNPPLFSYVLIAAYLPWLWLSPFETSAAWVTTGYTFARLWSVVFGTMTVALVYPVGRRLLNRSVGRVGVIMLALLFLPGRNAHFAVTDTATAFFTLLAIYFSLGIFRKQRWRDYLGAGLGVGLATGTKLTAGLVIVALLAAHFLVPHSKFRHNWRSPRLWGGLAVAVGIYLLIAIQLFWDLPHFIDTVVKHLQFGSEGYKGLQMSPVAGWGYYAFVLGWGIGWVMLAAVMICLATVVYRRYRLGWILIAFPVVLFLYMGAQKILFARFILPAVPPIILLVSLGLVWLREHWPFFQRYQYFVWPALLGLLLIQPLAYLVRFNQLIVLPDTRQLAAEWLATNYADDAVMVKESYAAPPLPFLYTEEWPYKVIHIDERGPTRDEITHYVSNKTDLIVVSNFTYARTRRDPAAEQARQAQLAHLEEVATLIKTFDPYQGFGDDNWFYLDQLYGPAAETMRRTGPGPLIRIYRLPYEKQPYSTTVPPVSVPVNANFDDKLTLLGYDLPVRQAEPGDSFPVTLVWQALDRMPEVFVVANRLLDKDQQPWGGYDRWPLETARTTLWQPGEVVVDTFSVSVSPAAPPGLYTLDIGLYDQADPTAAPLPLDRDGQRIDQTSVRLGPLKVGGPPPEIVQTGKTVTVDQPLNISLGLPPVIVLQDYNLVRQDISLELELVWESAGRTDIDWSIFAHLRNDAGETVAQKDGPAGHGIYPTSLWADGDVVVDHLTITVPDDLRPGNYSLVIGLYNLNDGSRLIVPDTVNNEIILEDGRLLWP
jgi:4-amino-4-deoxy-L-arabinose transferase-like glycosyltransferase